MNRSSLIGATLGAIAVTAVGAVAGYKALNSEQYAEVVAVRPVTETIRTPREDCRDEAVTQTAPTKDPHQVTGTIAGAVIGGLVGSKFGSGDGKTAATAAGAVAGGYAGNKVQEKMQAGNTVTTTEHRCTTVMDTSQKTVAYEVTYRLDGKQAVVRMDHDPGSRIPVKNGELVLSEAEEKS